MDKSSFGVVVPAPVVSAEQRKAEEAAIAKAKRLASEKKRLEAIAARQAALNRPLEQNLGAFLSEALKGKKLKAAR